MTEVVCVWHSSFWQVTTKKFLILSLSDVDVPSPDEKSVITYVSSIYDAFPKVPEGGEGINATVKEHFLKRLICLGRMY